MRAFAVDCVRVPAGVGEVLPAWRKRCLRNAGCDVYRCA